MKRLLLLCSLFLLLLARGNAEAYVTNTLLAEAAPDECFAGVGVDYPLPTSLEPFACPSGSVPKTNQTYVWGLTRSGDSLWFGTGPNVGCTTYGAFVSTDISEGSTSVCEYAESQIARENPIVGARPEAGDWRPPKIYEYNLTTKTLYDRTPNDPNINLSMGFRSAGSHNGVVFMAGGSLTGPVIMFAFNADTKAYLGSRTFWRYGTIRKWVVINNRLYTAMGVQAMPGSILRWTGSRTNPFSFVIVGTVQGVPRELAEYRTPSGETRIAVSGQGLWISPAMNSQGILPYSTATWRRVWSPTIYEPDPVLATAYGGGGAFQYEGWLYWGTTHIPNRGAEVHSSCTNNNCFGEPQTSAEETILYNGTYRSTSVWRARNLEGTTPEIQLLYGEAELPKFNPTTRTFDLTRNVRGYVPLYGPSGFGNSGNYYVWDMQTAAGKLFVGTMDLSGADLWSFDSPNLPAIREDGSGLGDSRDYGIRTMETSADGNTLYCGMASYSNLQGSSTTSKPGWDLRELVLNPLKPPHISPYGGSFPDPVTVTIASATPGQIIRYTLDGTDPIEGNPTSLIYQAPFVIDVNLTPNVTVNARGFVSGASSDLVTVSFSKAKAGTPAFTPDGGNHTTGPVSVTITDSTAGAAIYYTLDGSNPTDLSSLYQSPLELTSTVTLKAIAYAPNYLPSSIRSRTFTIGQVATPVINPAGATFTDSISVSISGPSSGDTVYYTLDGTEPTTDSIQYTGSFVLTDTTTVKAKGFILDSPEFLPSATATALFTKGTGTP